MGILSLLYLSLPVRERGLKPFGVIISYIKFVKSLPVRERGLKPVFSNTFFFTFVVAPRAGAWIETF